MRQAAPPSMLSVPSSRQDSQEKGHASWLGAPGEAPCTQAGCPVPVVVLLWLREEPRVIRRKGGDRLG